VVVVDVVVVEVVVVDGAAVVVVEVEEVVEVVDPSDPSEEQAPNNSSAAIATPARLNDGKESPSPPGKRRGLTRIPPLSG
jgi:hypothetical protein